MLTNNHRRPEERADTRPLTKTTTPINVALLGSRGIPASYGGFETLVETLASELPKDRFNITVFCESSLKKSRPEIARVNFVYFPVSDRFRLISEGFYDVVALAWASFARIDVVILFGYAAGWFCWLPRLFGKPVLVNVDGLEWKRGKFPAAVRTVLKFMELIVARTASDLICDSHAIESYYKRTYGADPEYVPNPAPRIRKHTAEGVRRFGLKSDGYYLVVARLEPENHIDMIIKGFLLSETSRKLVVVGPLNRTLYVQRLLEMRTAQILFLGGIFDRNTLTSLRAGTFAYIHGHEVGGTNPSLLEALACGNVSIAYDVVFNREVARDAAVYFSRPEELASEIRELETHPRDARNMRIRAKAIAGQEYSIDKCVNGYAYSILKFTQNVHR